MGKSSINGPFSMAMLNNQRVHFLVEMKLATSYTSYTTSIASLCPNMTESLVPPR